MIDNAWSSEFDREKTCKANQVDTQKAKYNFLYDSFYFE